MEVIDVPEFYARLKAQGVSNSNHACLICPICKTPQSMASLIAAGATPERAESSVGFSCEGRLTNAGPWPSEKDKSKKAVARRKVRGCDWTLGGLFRLHELEVQTEDGEKHPRFVIASAEVAQELERTVPQPAAKAT
jgi:hypothetical protein